MTSASPSTSPAPKPSTFASTAKPKESFHLSEAHQNALEERGISVEKASELGWHSLTRIKQQFLAIPYFRSGFKVGMKYRTLSDEKEFSQDQGSEQCLYNLDIIPELGNAPLVITEGEMDCIIGLQCGWMVVSVPNGAPAKRIESGEITKYDYIKDIPDSCREIILAVDGDQQGANLLHDLSIRLGLARCKWVKYPPGCKDLNDVYLAHGQKGVTDTLQQARWCEVDGLFRMSDLPPPSEAKPYPCPVDGMGENFKLRLGDFTVVTGIPSYGKTTFVNEVSCGMAKFYGWHVAVASFEQNPRQDHQRALRTYYAEKSPAYMTDAQLDAADKWIDENFTFMVPKPEEEVNLLWILEKVKAAIIRRGAKLIIVDPWNELDHDFPNGMSLTQYTGFAIKQFKKLAQKYMVHVIVVAHPAKMQRDRQTQRYPMPSLYDISDSSHWYNKPDVGIVVHRTDKGNTVIKMAKVRYFELIGRPGETVLEFNRNNNRFVHRPDMPAT